MRPLRVVARAALIAALASVAVTAPAGSRTPSRETILDPAAFVTVWLEKLTGTAGTATTPGEPALPSLDDLEPGEVLLEPGLVLPAGKSPPSGGLPVPKAIVVNRWRHDAEESWYGPGFYGEHTACGQTLTKTLLGVAHRSLPCGTLVSFRNPVNGKVVTVPVVDRGPYAAGRIWDLTKGACEAIDHCWTGALDWRFP